MKRTRPTAAAVLLFLLFAVAAEATCSYCGSSSYGSCPRAKSHKHTDYGADKCMYCGSSSFGSCSMSPGGHHEH